MSSFKKIIAYSLLLPAMIALTATSSFAATSTKSVTSSSSVVQNQQTTATAPIILKKKGGSKVGMSPSLSDTTYGNGGSATITLMSDDSFAWSINPSWFGPYEYTVYVRITNQYGNYVTQQKFGPGLSIGGTHSDVTGSFSYLPSGAYWATLIGTCVFDFGTAEIGEPTIPFYL